MVPIDLLALERKYIYESVEERELALTKVVPEVAEYVRATLLAKKEEGFLSYRDLPSLGRVKGSGQLTRLRVPN